MFVALFHHISIDSLEEVMEKSAACQRGKILLNSEMNSRDFQFCIRMQDGKKERYWKDEKKKILPLVMFYLDTSASRLAALACVEASWELSSSLRPWAPRTFNYNNNNNNNNHNNDNNKYENDNNGLHEPLPLPPQAGPPPPENLWDLISNWDWDFKVKFDVQLLIASQTTCNVVSCSFKFLFSRRNSLSWPS